jgi:hypothetical protein
MKNEAERKRGREESEEEDERRSVQIRRDKSLQVNSHKDSSTPRDP